MELLADGSAESSGRYVHSHGGRAHVHKPIDPTLGWRSLIAVGFAGGLLPSPSALVVLLGAIALGRTWFGLILVTAYGLGMAGMLTTAGLLLVRARSWLERRANQRSSRWLRAALLSHVLPLVTALIIMGVGLFLAARATAQL
jgi:ABC-type nickel/cobalt efflux system permease component RcnA